MLYPESDDYFKMTKFSVEVKFKDCSIPPKLCMNCLV